MSTVIINVPSQVKEYANLAAFPIAGVVKTIYIAEDTDKTYRWNGSAYVELSSHTDYSDTLTVSGSIVTLPQALTFINVMALNGVVVFVGGRVSSVVGVTITLDGDYTGEPFFISGKY